MGGLYRHLVEANRLEPNLLIAEEKPLRPRRERPHEPARFEQRAPVADPCGGRGRHCRHYPARTRCRRCTTAEPGYLVPSSRVQSPDAEIRGWLADPALLDVGGG